MRSAELLADRSVSSSQDCARLSVLALEHGGKRRFRMKTQRGGEP